MDGGGERRESHARRGHDAEGSFRTDDVPAEVVAGGGGRFGSEAPDAAVGQDDVDGEDVRRGHAVGEAVGTAGVRVHVPADRADLLRRGIRRVREAAGPQGVPEVEVEDAGLDPRQPVLGSDLEDAVHLGGDDDDRVRDRRRTAGETGPAPTRHDREVVPRRHLHARHDVVRRVDEYDEPRAPLDHGRVPRVEPQRERVGEHRLEAERVDQIGAGCVQVRHVCRLRR